MTELEKITSMVDADLDNILNEITNLKNRVLQLEQEKMSANNWKRLKDFVKRTPIACFTKRATL